MITKIISTVHIGLSGQIGRKSYRYWAATFVLNWMTMNLEGINREEIIEVEHILFDFPSESWKYKNNFCPGDEREERDFICSGESHDRFSSSAEKSRNSTHATVERECYGNSELAKSGKGSNICLG